MNKELLKQFLLEETDVEEEVSEKDYESIIDKIGIFLSTLDPDSLSDTSQEALFILYNSLAEVYDLDKEEEEPEEESEDEDEDEDEDSDDNLDEVKIRRISRSKHRKSHLNYIKKKRKMGGKMKMKAKLARRTGKYKMWAKRYARKKKAGRTGKIRYS
jgi:hypothetical protein